MIKEMFRVSKKVIIIEDVYTNYLEKAITFLKDWCYNRLESFSTPIPLNFCTDSQWESLFNSLDINVLDKLVISRFLITRAPRQMGYLLCVSDRK